MINRASKHEFSHMAPRHIGQVTHIKQQRQTDIVFTHCRQRGALKR